MRKSRGISYNQNGFSPPGTGSCVLPNLLIRSLHQIDQSHCGRSLEGAYADRGSISTADESITSVKDLSGKTVLTTGQGATPEYAMNYLLDANGVADCTLEFHSEASEIAALLKEDPNRIAVLPQPFVTAAEAQNDQLKTAFSLTDEWDKVTDNGSRFLTGATIVRKAFLEEHPDAAAVFLREQEASADEANTNVEGTAALVAEYGIIEKAPIAQKALPYCNIVCITGEDMKTALSGYLDVLYQADPSSVGGSLPADDFYDIAD